MISGNVAPFARFIIAITSAFLLVRLAFGLLVAFLAFPAFLAGLGGFAAGLGPRRLRRRLITVITPVGRNIKGNLRATRVDEVNAATG
jgi:hypothetical protein